MSLPNLARFAALQSARVQPAHDLDPLGVNPHCPLVAVATGLGAGLGVEAHIDNISRDELGDDRGVVARLLAEVDKGRAELEGVQTRVDAALGELDLGEGHGCPVLAPAKGFLHRVRARLRSQAAYDQFAEKDEQRVTGHSVVGSINASVRDVGCVHGRRQARLGSSPRKGRQQRKAAGHLGEPRQAHDW